MHNVNNSRLSSRCSRWRYWLKIRVCLGWRHTCRSRHSLGSLMGRSRCHSALLTVSLVMITLNRLYLLETVKDGRQEGSLPLLNSLIHSMHPCAVVVARPAPTLHACSSSDLQSAHCHISWLLRTGIGAGCSSSESWHGYPQAPGSHPIDWSAEAVAEVLQLSRCSLHAVGFQVECLVVVRYVAEMLSLPLTGALLWLVVILEVLMLLSTQWWRGFQGYSHGR